MEGRQGREEGAATIGAVRAGRCGPGRGGWRFEQFKGDSRSERLVTAEIAARCFACHTQRKDKDFVFSSPRQ